MDQQTDFIRPKLTLS